MSRGTDPRNPSEAHRVSAPDGVESLLRRGLGALCALLVGGMVVLLSAQVLARQTGLASLVWSGEMATWLFSWTAFIGAVLVYMEKKHIVIDFLTSFFPHGLVSALNWFHQIVILAILITLLVTGVKITLLYANQSATSIELSKAFLFSSLPISSALMIFWTVYGWIQGRAK